jgi:uncharacterized membrane protein YagU involved in acid resistance
MSNIIQGIIAGFVATVVMSVMLVAKNAMGIMPELDIITMLTGMMKMGDTASWVAHFAYGTVILGGLYALIEARIPGGSQWMKGAVYGVGVWLVMMIIVMPMAGAGFFGLYLGMMAAVMTLVVHLIFGAVLGYVFGALVARKAA